MSRVDHAVFQALFVSIAEPSLKHSERIEKCWLETPYMHECLYRHGVSAQRHENSRMMQAASKNGSGCGSTCMQQGSDEVHDEQAPPTKDGGRPLRKRANRAARDVAYRVSLGALTNFNNHRHATLLRTTISTRQK